MQLPPKRFQDDKDPKYDSIRHLPWFHTLGSRREKIALLEQAFYMVRHAADREDAAKEFGVDIRELRDFIDFESERSKFSELEPTSTRKSYQLLLDQAYDVYRDTGGARPLTQIVNEQSYLFGVNARHVVELWEIDATWYPSQYRGIK